MMPVLRASLSEILPYYPPGSSEVRLTTQDGVVLCGVFVPAGPEAPVVLHLLGAAQSPATLHFPVDWIAWEFADRGYASLLVDYRGIGASFGKSDVNRLGDDAWCMWKEALQRAGGKPERVLIRGTSLGTIATALLIQQGARPGAIFLFAPVFPDSVVSRFARSQHGFLASWLASLIYRSVAKVNLAEELTKSEAPLSVVVISNDTWSSEKEKETLLQIARLRSPHAQVHADGDHLWGVVSHPDLHPGERDFLSSILTVQTGTIRSPETAQAQLGREALMAIENTPAARERFLRLATDFQLVPAEHLAAAALEQPDHRISAELIRIFRHSADRRLPFEGLRFLYSTNGLNTEATLALLRAFIQSREPIRRGFIRDTSSWSHPSGIALNTSQIGYANPTVRMRALDPYIGTTFSFDMKPKDLETSFKNETEYRHWIARIMLKVSGFADRLVEDDNGDQRVEWFSDGVWTRLPL